LAVFDTFLIYLIAQHRYNSRNAAFAAAMLFAGMPLTSLLLRRVWLEPIQLPFILLSILFALWVQRSNINETRITGDDDDDYIKGIQSKDHGKSMTVTPGHFYKRRMRRRTRTRRNAFLLTIISGAFLGIAMFTKVPAFTFTPLLGFLIYNNNLGRKRKILFFLWLVPLLGIVMIWPVYAFSVGNIGEWTDGILWQTNREGRDLFYSLQYDLAIDPVLLILGGAGLIYAILRKDLFILFWIVPFFIFLYLIGFVSFWHLIPALPAFCIAIARMINEVTHSVIRRAFFKELIPLLVILGLVTAEIAYTAPSIISGSNQNIYSTVTILTDYLKKEDDRIKEESSEHKKTVTVIGDPSYLWIPQYVFKLDNFDYKTYSGDALDASNRAILIADQGLVRALSLDTETSKVLERMYSSNNTKTIITIGDNGPKSSQVSILSYDPLFLQIPS
jgi:4-amino-4-deoxy-L-arabinose transferase-like glycosyltransferase